MKLKPELLQPAATIAAARITAAAAGTSPLRPSDAAHLVAAYRSLEEAIDQIESENLAKKPPLKIHPNQFSGA
jgi:hypothetical protein